MAVRKPRYLEMAVDMALSLREHTSLPVALATDDVLGPLARERYGSVFDAMTRVPSRFLEGRALKFGSAEASPFEETIFVDADCIVLDRLDHLWESVGTGKVVMVGEHLSSGDDRRHHGFSTRALMRRFGLKSYFKTNSGVFCFRRSAALEIMEECLVCYREEARPSLRWLVAFGAWVGDEIAFGIVGGRRGLGTLPSPAPMYWVNEIETLDPLRPSKPLLHMIWPPRPAVQEALLGATTERRRAAQVPGDAKEHWRHEFRKLRRMAWRRRLLRKMR